MIRAAANMLLYAGILSVNLYAFSPSVPADHYLNMLMSHLSIFYDIPLPACYYQQPCSYYALDSFFSQCKQTQLLQQEQDLISKVIQKYGTEGRLYNYQRKEQNMHLTVHCNLLGDVQPGYHDSALMKLSGIFQPSLYGNIGNVSFYSGFSVWTEYRSDTLFSFPTYQPYDGVAYNLYGRDTDHSHVRSSDLPYGGISYDAGRIRLEGAIDRLRSGPARWYPLTFSGASPPITFARISCDCDIIHYTHVAGLLKGQKDKRKYLFMHRLEGNLWKERIHYGINEVVIYGSTTNQPAGPLDSIGEQYIQNDRRVEPEYCIPFLPFKFIEHYAGDRDNATVSFDISLNWPRQWNFYGEFFLDDILSPWKIFADDWGNKWAMTIGGSYFGILDGKPFSIHGEISRVEPWVYTHFGGGSHRYTHFDKCLGSPTGPNSFAGVLQVLIQMSSRNQIGFGVDCKANDSSARGGALTDVFQHPDPADSLRYSDSTKKTWLGRGSVWRLQPVLYWNYDRFGLFSVNSSLSVDVLDDRGYVQLAMYGGLFF